MLSRSQIILLKNAQRDAGLDDTDYRDAIATVTATPDCRSGKDPRLTDGHLDKLLAWFEAIYQALPAEARRASSVFKVRDYWKNKNQKGNTSRDRFTAAHLDAEIADHEARLAALGYGPQYLRAIQDNLRGKDSFTKTTYLGALARTLKSKQRKADAKEANVPF